MAQRGKATCPRSHSKGGAQLGPLTQSPRLQEGGCSWSWLTPSLSGCPVANPLASCMPLAFLHAQSTHRLLGGQRIVLPLSLELWGVCSECVTRNQEWGSSILGGSYLGGGLSLGNSMGYRQGAQACWGPWLPAAAATLALHVCNPAGSRGSSPGSLGSSSSSSTPGNQ